MRLLLVLLVLLRLDPIIGAALCLQKASRESEECTMPEHPSAAERTVGSLGSHAEIGCAFAKLCIPPALAISESSSVSILVPPLHKPPTGLERLAGPLGSLTPPFHPPRV